jgi:hypothetical protein
LWLRILILLVGILLFACYVEHFYAVDQIAAKPKEWENVLNMQQKVLY